MPYKDPEKQREYQRQWETDHKAERLEAKRKAHAANPEKEWKRLSKWHQDNPEKKPEYSRKRRALKCNAEANFSPWMERYYRYSQGQRCYYCGETMLRDCSQYDARKENLEHLTPLSRGGAHNWINTRLACKECNGRKGTKTAEEFLKEK